MEFHFLRPLWLLALIPWIICFLMLLRKPVKRSAWANVCDEALLKQMLEVKKTTRSITKFIFLFFSIFFTIIAISGPTWHKKPIQLYKKIMPRVVVLDLTDNMLTNDIKPSRLVRAKFKLHDLFSQKDNSQYGLVVFSGEPFVVSPLTDDAKTIDSLLSMLAPDIMPVGGHNLGFALEEAGKLITNAGFTHGDILVLSAEPPTANAAAVAESLNSKGIHTSVIPIGGGLEKHSLYTSLARAGGGNVYKFTDTKDDILQWLSASRDKLDYADIPDNIPLWADEGRWFLLPALILLLPLFRKGWLQRVDS